jgi:capsular polysaccharide biosynthesis protein
VSPPVELPQLSLARYFELVKRRRWSLVPVSLLGLVVGALVAFLIPRYYVAETVIERHSLADDVIAGVDDPLAEIVDGAERSLPQAAGAAMEALKWPEALVADPSARTQAEKAVRERIFVYDLNPQRGRKYALIKVLYSDTDPRRAADMANTVVNEWIRAQIVAMKGPVQRDRAEASSALADATQTHNGHLQKQRDQQVRYRLHAELTPTELRSRQSERQRNLAEDSERIIAKEGERAVLEANLARNRAALAATPERVLPDPVQMAELAKGNPQVAALLLDIEARKLALRGWAEGSSEHRNKARSLAAREQLLQLLLGFGGDTSGMVPNPAFEALATAVKADEEKLTQVKAELAARQRAADAAAQEVVDLAEGTLLIAKTETDIEMSKKELDRAFAAVEKFDQYLRKLDAENPISVQQKATPPPHPTDPNIVVVAAIGALLGLAVAIGLILLLDFLQGSFKTAEEVERGLGVPVLGAISHLQTDEERVSTARGRRRASVVAISFVALVVVVVTIYYRAPSRLPAPVRDLLALLLGT